VPRVMASSSLSVPPVVLDSLTVLGPGIELSWSESDQAGELHRPRSGGQTVSQCPRAAVELLWRWSQARGRANRTVAAFPPIHSPVSVRSAARVRSGLGSTLAGRIGVLRISAAIAACTADS